MFFPPLKQFILRERLGWREIDISIEVLGGNCILSWVKTNKMGILLCLDLWLWVIFPIHWCIPPCCTICCLIPVNKSFHSPVPMHLNLYFYLFFLKICFPFLISNCFQTQELLNVPLKGRHRYMVGMKLLIAVEYD